MDWKTKSKIQNTISFLPNDISYAAYYWLQRHFGSLKTVQPEYKLSAGIQTWKLLKNAGFEVKDKVFFEVGTGRIPLVPLAFWLMGASKIITVDLNPYLKKELFIESIDYIINNKDSILSLFGDELDIERLSELHDLHSRRNRNLSDYLDLCAIEYYAPADAAATVLPDGCIDFHTSYTVFEHIPPEILLLIFKEGNRISRSSGAFIHKIDYSDHYSHSDANISAINFLKFSDQSWEKYSGNRYMYMNRMRHDDFIELYNKAGHEILVEKPETDQKVREILETGEFPLHERFQNKSREILAIRNSWIISRKL